MAEKITLAKGLNMGLRKAMEDDPKVLVMGEDVGKLGGVFRITDGLQKDFGEDRVIDSPLAESGIVGTAVGMALRGYKLVVEIQFDGFVYPAYDQIVCQVAKMCFRSRGQTPLPMVSCCALTAVAPSKRSARMKVRIAGLLVLVQAGVERLQLAAERGGVVRVAVARVRASRRLKKATRDPGSIERLVAGCDRGRSNPRHEVDAQDPARAGQGVATQEVHGQS